MWKINQESEVSDEIPFRLYMPSININCIADGFKSIKTDSDGQYDFKRWKNGYMQTEQVQNSFKVVGEENQVLKIKKDGKV
jgi:hypothetical protein